MMGVNSQDESFEMNQADGYSDVNEDIQALVSSDLDMSNYIYRSDVSK